MTLDDLERPKRTLVEKIALGKPPEKKSNEDGPILLAAKCRSMILVSGNITLRLVRRFVGVPYTSFT